jgi:hypothetical protein
MRKFLILLALAAAFGFFLLNPEEKGDGLILAEAPDFGGVDPALLDEEDEDGESEPAAPIEPIEGRVVRVDGEPVVGARIALEHAWVPEVSAVSDENGAFQLTPSERRGELVLRSGGQLLLGGERNLSDAKSDGYLLVVADPVTVRGRVVDPSGAIVAGARVFGHPPSDAMVPFGIASLPLASDDQLGFTADDGTFVLGPLPDVPRSLIEVTSKGFETARIPFPIEAGQEVLIVLDPG